MNTRKRYYRRSTAKNRRRKTGKRKYGTHAKHYGKQTMKRSKSWGKEPIITDSDWRSMKKFEQKWGVMRRGREWPKH